ncbi:MAG TPA: hypothetical protein VIC59_12310 [Gemmatimonadota bacterium]|jgi:hypothetical protein
MRALVTGIFVALLTGAAVTSLSAQTLESRGDGQVIASGPALDGSGGRWGTDGRLRLASAELWSGETPAPVLLARSRSEKRTGTALMIVGAAGIVTGLVVDESIITIAGAGVGGYGLFLYLR